MSIREDIILKLNSLSNSIDREALIEVEDFSLLLEALKFCLLVETYDNNKSKIVKSINNLCNKGDIK